MIYNVLLTICALVSAGADVSLAPGTSLHFLPVAEARQELGRADVFLRSLSPFDRSARLKRSSPVDPTEFITFVQAQALDWTDTERGTLIQVFDRIRERIAPYAKHLPARIHLIKTTGAEEGDAAYCRHNAIVLPVQKLQLPPESLRKLLEHELFHIISRNNGQLRDRLYAIVGFKPCPEVSLPEPYLARKLTNPDAPVIQHFIEVNDQGAVVQAMPVLFSRTAVFDPAAGNNFFDFLTFKLMVLEQHDGTWRASLQNGQPRFVEVSTVGNYFEQIGRNTKYIIHPEEILADNFQLLLEGKGDLPSPEIPRKIAAVLARGRE